MLAFVCCDAKVRQPALAELTRRATACSFNRITVDGDTSTNDAFVVCATGKADHPVINGPGPAFDALLDGLSKVATELAQRIIRDAEGATKFVTVRVAGGASEASACRSPTPWPNPPWSKPQYSPGTPIGAASAWP